MKKFWYFVFCFLCFIVCKETVSATSIVGYGECSYNVVDSSMEKMYEKYVDDNIRTATGSDLTFGFSEVLRKDGVANQLLVRTNHGDDVWYDVANSDKNQFSNKNFSNKGSELATYFYKEFNTNGGKCPKYFIIKKVSGKNSSSLFASDYESYCSNNGDNKYANCDVVAVLGNSEIYSEDSDEIKWVFNSSILCSTPQYTTVSLYTKSDGTLMANLYVAKNSNAYDISAKNESGVDVSVNYHGINNGLEALRTLYVNNHAKISFGVKKGKEVVYLLKSLQTYSASNSQCTVYVSSFDKVYNCNLYSEIKDDVESTWNEAKKYLFTDEYNADLSGIFQFTGTSGYIRNSDGSLLLSSVDKLDETALKQRLDKVTNLISTTTSFDGYVDKLKNYDVSSLCTSEKTKYYSFMDTTKNSVDLMNRFEEGLVKESELITARLKEIGSTTSLSYVEQSEKNTEILTEQQNKLNAFTVNLKTSHVNLAEGSNLTQISAKTGCDAIEPLYDYLQLILNWIRGIGIALAVVLQVIDYIKVIFGSSDDSMVKANKHLSIRIIAVALLFLIPALITFILALFNIAGTGDAGTCGIV